MTEIVLFNSVILWLKGDRDLQRKRHWFLRNSDQKITLACQNSRHFILKINDDQVLKHGKSFKSIRTQDLFPGSSLNSRHKPINDLHRSLLIMVLRIHQNKRAQFSTELPLENEIGTESQGTSMCLLSDSFPIPTC